MQKRKLIWHIYPPLVLVIVFAMAATSWYASSSLRSFFLEQTGDNLQILAKFILARVEEPFRFGNGAHLEKLCRDIGAESATRVTVITKTGEVVADSTEQAARMDNHSDRVEVRQALAGRGGSSLRYSQTLKQNMLYVARPIYDRDSSSGSSPGVAGVLRLAIPVTAIDQALGQVYGKLLFSSILLIIIAALITLAVSRRITLPIEKIRRSAERFAGGDLTGKIVFGRDQRISLELQELAAAMNKMARQLDDRISKVTEQRNELETVFASMVEAVLVVDTEERLLSANKAALTLLDLDENRLQGRSIVEIVRNPALLQFIRKTLALTTMIEENLVLHEAGGRETALLARGKALPAAHGHRGGCLVVFNDVTRLRRLESVRSDFVANVSHELKTPITTIKGFIETLQDGALDDPVAARRFVEIILKNANRLNAIVDDLLALARIEAADNNSRIERETTLLSKVLAGAVETCAPGAEVKNLAITVDCPADLSAEINGPLLQQALANLVLNAVKYSHPGGEIKVAARLVADAVIIRVEDFGVGIEAEHLPRLFERFYRSDKARSRQLGGTGLGLAIVKHIVQAHGGRVEVASTPGRGTVFTVMLPAA